MFIRVFPLPEGTTMDLIDLSKEQTSYVFVGVNISTKACGIVTGAMKKSGTFTITEILHIRLTEASKEENANKVVCLLLKLLDVTDFSLVVIGVEDCVNSRGVTTRSGISLCEINSMLKALCWKNIGKHVIPVNVSSARALSGVSKKSDAINLLQQTLVYENQKAYLTSLNMNFQGDIADAFIVARYLTTTVE